MKKSRATLVIHDKVLLQNGVIVEIKIWDISKDSRYPEHFKYSLYAVYNGEVLVGYDNHYPKGHHRHINNKQESYCFTTIENLKKDFKSDVEKQIKKRGLK